MVDFRKLISPQSRARNREIDAALAEFSDLDAPEMARSLLDMSRRAFELGGFREDRYFSYDEAALLRIVPEIALRLDPTVELTDLETAKPEEAEDKVTWIKGSTNDRLKEMVDSCIAHASFAKILHGADGKDDEHADERERLHDMFSIRRDEGVIVRAFEKLEPGSYSFRQTSEKPPLDGFYVILEHEDDRHRVMDHFATEQQADDLLDAAVRHLRDPETEDLNTLRDYSYRIRSTKPVLAVSIQDFEGSVLKRNTIAPGEDGPEP